MGQRVRTSAKCSTRRRRSPSPGSPSRSGCARDCSTSAPKASSPPADSRRALIGLRAAGGTAGAVTLPLCVLAARAGGRRGGWRARRAQGEVRRARSDHDDHAQLHRARAAQLSRRGAHLTVPERCTRRRSTPARCRGSVGFRRCVPRLRGERRARSSCCSPRSCAWWFLFRTRAASSSARSACSRTPRSTAASTSAASGCARWRCRARSPDSAGSTSCSATSTTTRTVRRRRGFLGIAVAIVGRNHPIGVLLAALVLRDAVAGRARGERAWCRNKSSTCCRGS